MTKMNLESEWLILCSQVIADRRSGNLTLVNCLEELTAPKFPALHHSFAFAARYRAETPSAEDKSVAYRVRRFDSDGTERQVGFLEGVWQAGTTRARIFINFRFLRLFAPGTIRFQIDYRLNGAEWVPGSEAVLVVNKADLSEEEMERFQAEQARLRDDLTGESE